MSDVSADVDAGQGGDAGKSSSQDNTVPLAALQAERANRQRLETQLAELKGTVDTLKQTQQQPREYTRAELQAAVDSGQASQVDADRILEEQQTRKLETKVATNVEAKLQAQEMGRKIQSEIDAYREFEPKIMEEGSDARILVAGEYNRQVNELGKPANLQTELDALSATYGPASKLQKGKTKEPETHQEGGSDSGDGGTKIEGKAPKGLTSDAKRHYEKQIERGMYKGWDDVAKELEGASPSVKRRLGV